MKNCPAILAALLLSATLSFADRISLADGSVLNGSIKSIKDGKAIVETAFAGEITIAADQIVKFTTASAVEIAKNDGSKLSGVIDQQNDTAVIGTVPLTLGEIGYLWLPGEADPTIPPPPEGRKWDGEISLDITGKTGNSEKFNGGIGTKANLTGPVDKLQLYGEATYNRENHETNTKKYVAGADYEQKIADTKNAWYAKLEFEKQTTSGLRLRSEAGAGYGYYFIDKERTKLRGRIGLTAKSRKYTDGTKSDALGGEASLHFEQDIQEWGKLTTDLLYQPTFDSLHDYRIVHDSALDIPVLFKFPLALRLGVQNEYNSRTAADADRLDTTYYAKLLYKWK